MEEKSKKENSTSKTTALVAGILVVVVLLLFVVNPFGIGKSPIERKLDGVWSDIFSMAGMSFMVYYSFDGDEVIGEIERVDFGKNNNVSRSMIFQATGTYEIADEKIFIEWENEKDFGKEYTFSGKSYRYTFKVSDELSYKYEDGELTLFTRSPLKSGGELELTK